MLFIQKLKFCKRDNGFQGPFCTCPYGAEAEVGDDGTITGCGPYYEKSTLSITTSAVATILLCLLILISKFL